MFVLDLISAFLSLEDFRLHQFADFTMNADSALEFSTFFLYKFGFLC